MALQGGGLIDGRGEQWWNLPCKPHKVLVIVLLNQPNWYNLHSAKTSPLSTTGSQQNGFDNTV